MAVRFTILLINTFSSLACMKNDELEKFNFTNTIINFHFCWFNAFCNHAFDLKSDKFNFTQHNNCEIIMNAEKII